MKAHLRYAWYVLLHKSYVLCAGILIGPNPALGRLRWARWLWRLLVHDLSKLSRAEWSPYVAMFYGPKTTVPEIARARQAAFDRAWLHHLHHNPHHWQHWILHEDSGKTRVLVPAAWIADEMVADWLAAGRKILGLPTMLTCVAETITWYAAHRDKMQLRQPVAERVEAILHGLADAYGLLDHAKKVRAATAARDSLTVVAR